MNRFKRVFNASVIIDQLTGQLECPLARLSNS
jgi:hypothetical protein